MRNFGMVPITAIALLTAACSGGTAGSNSSNAAGNGNVSSTSATSSQASSVSSVSSLSSVSSSTSVSSVSSMSSASSVMSSVSSLSSSSKSSLSASSSSSVSSMSSSKSSSSSNSVSSTSSSSSSRSSSSASSSTSGSVVIAIDANADLHPISPLIYGVAAFSDIASNLKDINAPINRHGGNAVSLYNWQANASNRGSDWYFESIADGAATQAGSILDIVTANRQAGADSMITLGMTGWVAKVTANRDKTACFSIAKYGTQSGADVNWMPDAGNGVKPDGSLVTGNDPNDCAVPATSDTQKGLVQLLTQSFGLGGVRYYLMDNESALWHTTHRSVHPQPATMDEIYGDIVSYGGMVKAVDAQALIVAPEEWGWTNYFDSAKDAALSQWGHGPDRAAHGGMDYMPWLLQSLHNKEQQTGRRLLDVFSLHYYPQGGEYSDDTSTTMQRRRNRSTRSLWDPNYVDETWINNTVRLIPRMKDWVNQNYPGTKIGITEYSWGADTHINGATTQADVLGILGREGADIATRWTIPATSTPTFKAFQMFRNYDGAKSSFGEQSVRAVVPDPDQLSAFAARRTSDGALTIIVINKEFSAQPVTLQLTNFVSSNSAVQRWQLTSANQILRLTDVNNSGLQVSDTVPAQSITTYIIH